MTDKRRKVQHVAPNSNDPLRFSNEDTKKLFHISFHDENVIEERGIELPDDEDDLFIKLATEKGWLGFVNHLDSACPNLVREFCANVTKPVTGHS